MIPELLLLQATFQPLQGLFDAIAYGANDPSFTTNYKVLSLIPFLSFRFAFILLLLFLLLRIPFFVISLF